MDDLCADKKVSWFEVKVVLVGSRGIDDLCV